MPDYSPYYQPKSNLKYIGINISEGIEPDRTRRSDYNGEVIALYDVTKFSPSTTASDKTKNRYLEYIVHLCLKSNIYWKNGKPFYSSVDETILGESFTDALLTSIKKDHIKLTYNAISYYIQLHRNRIKDINFI